MKPAHLSSSQVFTSVSDLDAFMTAVMILPDTLLLIDYDKPGFYSSSFSQFTTEVGKTSI